MAVVNLVTWLKINNYTYVGLDDEIHIIISRCIYINNKKKTLLFN